MGRSGGKNRIQQRTGQTRGQLRLLSDQDLNDLVVNNQEPKTYVPGEDHDQLLSDAMQLWALKPEYILDPEWARENWDGFLEENETVDRNSPGYWEQALQALVFQAETTKFSKPVFRGQPVLGDHPIDRIRGWSEDIELAARFSLSKDLILETEDGHKHINFSEAKKTAQRKAVGETSSGVFGRGGKLIVAIYAIDNPEHGLSFNDPLLAEQRKKEALDQFEKGFVENQYHRLDPVSGEWKRMREGRRLAEMKRQAIDDILNNADWGDVAEQLGLAGEPSYASLYLAISRDSDFKTVEELLVLAGQREKAESFGREIEEIRTVIENEPNIYAADVCHLDEKEVIVPESGAKKAHRFEVVLAESDEELALLSFNDAFAKIKNAVKTGQGQSVVHGSVGQLTIDFDG